MTRTNGWKTRDKILGVAEKLFSKKGFDATGVEEIANVAGVNKALIYYHFKNKEALLDALSESIIHDTIELLNESFEDSHAAREHSDEFIQSFGKLIEFLEQRKSIISIMFMESLKKTDKHRPLFKCFELIMNQEYNKLVQHIQESKPALTSEQKRFLLFEFFTGFIPLISFAVFREKWSEYFQYDYDQMLNDFLDVFKMSHIQHESEPN